MKKTLHINQTKSYKNLSGFLGLFLLFTLSMNLSGQKLYTTLDEIWTSGSWQKSSLQTNTYDGSGYLTNSLSQAWVSGAWSNNTQINYTNNVDGTVNRSVFQQWNGVSAWNNFIR